jgi:hypothetical protein
MTAANSYRRITCASCGHTTVCGPPQLLALLRAAGKLRRALKPDWQLIALLADDSAGSLACPQCSQSGLSVWAAEDFATEDWPQTRTCERCRTIIPMERLELFPDARLCVACQRSAEQGRDDATPEFCPRCGALMTLKQHRGAGLTRYVSVCSECRR